MLNAFLLTNAYAGVPSSAVSASQTLLSADNGHIAVDAGIFYHLESSPLDRFQMSGIEPSKWTALRNEVLDLGSTPDTVWLRFNVRNVENKDVRWFMEISWPLLDQIEVYLFDRGTGSWDGPMISGIMTPIDGRAVASMRNIFPLSLKAGADATIYIRTWSSTKTIVPIELWQKEALHKNTVIQLTLLGIFFGILTIMFAYNLLLYFPTRDKTYLSFSFFVFSLVLYLLMATGTGTFYFWAKVVWLKSHGYGLFSSLVFLGAAIYFRDYLRLKQYGGWVLNLNTIVIGFWGILFGLYTIHTFPLIVAIEDIGALLSSITGLVTVFYIWKLKVTSVRLFTIAWIFLTGTTNMLIISQWSLAGTIIYASYAQMGGFAITVMLLSFALPQRISRERAARSEAKKRALALSQKIAEEQSDTLEVRKNTLAYQRRIHEELAKRVKARTIELGQAMAQLESANRELAHLNLTDSLTKVYNRRFFDQALSERIRQAGQTGKTLVVALADIDHFKSINDTFGHLIGDACLELTARTIQENVSLKNALVARYGGEEFAVIMTDTCQQDAYQVAEKVRAAIESLAFNTRDKSIDLRISIGLAAWTPESGESPDHIVQAADQALYCAKQAGRNQVAIADVR